MGKYDDILYLDRPISKNHKQMSIYDRSAQFAPFAALVGYEESIKEAARKTVDKIELSADEIELLSKKLAFLYANLSSHPLVSITYFKKDERKKGGNYINDTGSIKKIDIQEKKISLSKNNFINFDDIIDIVIIENEKT